MGDSSLINRTCPKTRCGSIWRGLEGYNRFLQENNAITIPYSGKWNNTTWVAVKTLKQGAMTTDEFLKEARIMKNLNHPKLVKLYAVCTDDPIYIVTELMTHGSLLAYLRDGPGKNLDMKMLVDLMAQVSFLQV